MVLLLQASTSVSPRPVLDRARARQSNVHLRGRDVPDTIVQSTAEQWLPLSSLTQAPNQTSQARHQQRSEHRHHYDKRDENSACAGRPLTPVHLASYEDWRREPVLAWHYDHAHTAAVDCAHAHDATLHNLGSSSNSGGGDTSGSNSRSKSNVSISGIKCAGCCT
jgi:hypothetical protein